MQECHEDAPRGGDKKVPDEEIVQRIRKEKSSRFLDLANTEQWTKKLDQSKWVNKVLQRFHCCLGHEQRKEKTSTEISGRTNPILVPQATDILYSGRDNGGRCSSREALIDLME
jgi:hypothetical protein